LLSGLCDRKRQDFTSQQRGSGYDFCFSSASSVTYSHPNSNAYAAAYSDAHTYSNTDTYSDADTYPDADSYAHADATAHADAHADATAHANTHANTNSESHASAHRAGSPQQSNNYCSFAQSGQSYLD
jgi:hypothetical protein